MIARPFGGRHESTPQDGCLYNQLQMPGLRADNPTARSLLSSKSEHVGGFRNAGAHVKNDWSDL
jgi:hypothetical protein